MADVRRRQSSPVLRCTFLSSCLCLLHRSMATCCLLRLFMRFSFFWSSRMTNPAGLSHHRMLVALPCRACKYPVHGVASSDALCDAFFLVATCALTPFMFEISRENNDLGRRGENPAPHSLQRAQDSARETSRLAHGRSLELQPTERMVQIMFETNKSGCQKRLKTQRMSCGRCTRW